MSRSYKKHPLNKWNDSEKENKQNSNRKFRRKNRQKDYEDDEVYFHNKTREVIDNWTWGSDGYKHYFPNKPEFKRK